MIDIPKFSNKALERSSAEAGIIQRELADLNNGQGVRLIEDLLPQSEYTLQCADIEAKRTFRARVTTTQETEPLVKNERDRVIESNSRIELITVSDPQIYYYVRKLVNANNLTEWMYELRVTLSDGNDRAFALVNDTALQREKAAYADFNADDFSFNTHVYKTGYPLTSALYVTPEIRANDQGTKPTTFRTFAVDSFPASREISRGAWNVRSTLEKIHRNPYFRRG